MRNNVQGSSPVSTKFSPSFICHSDFFIFLFLVMPKSLNLVPKIFILPSEKTNPPQKKTNKKPVGSSGCHFWLLMLQWVWLSSRFSLLKWNPVLHQLLHKYRIVLPDQTKLYRNHIPNVFIHLIISSDYSTDLNNILSLVVSTLTR